MAGLASQMPRMNGLTVVFAAYAVFSIALIPEYHRQSKWSHAAALVVDMAYFALWCRFSPSSWVGLLALSYLLTSAVLFFEVARAVAFAALGLFLSLVLPYPSDLRLAWFTGALGACAVAFAFYKRYVQAQLSRVLRQNVFIRSQAEASRDAERERIAADFHDGPLQSFVSFQMRLQVIKTLLARGAADAATEEVNQLQEIGKTQASDLRAFARTMRPVEQLGLRESLAELVDIFQRDTSISASLSLNGVPDLLDAAPHLLQIVREALHNAYKHSGASRVLVSACRRENDLQITVQDNGSGFPFTGTFNLDELERQRLGPISIKRRVRLLNGDLLIESQPGQGAKLEVRIPS